LPVAEAGQDRSLAARAAPRHWLGWAVNGSALGSSTIVLFLMVLVVADVTGRYVFNSPVPMTYEIGSFMLVFIVFLGMAYTQRAGSHIKVEFLTLRLSPKARAVLDLLSYTLGIMLYAAIFYQGFRWAYEGFRVGDYTPGLVAIPRWPSMFAVPFGALLLCLQFSGDWFRRFRELKTL
jgi:TRAP-type C4-dicarboxylate transport system permease small subunit